MPLKYISRKVIFFAINDLELNFILILYILWQVEGSRPKENLTFLADMSVKNLKKFRFFVYVHEEKNYIFVHHVH